MGFQMWSNNGCLTLERCDAHHCLVYEAGYPSSPKLVLKAQKTPGELMVFSLCWKPKEVGSLIRNRMNEPASKSEGDQAKVKLSPSMTVGCQQKVPPTVKLSPSMSIYVGCQQKVPPTVKVDLPASNNWTKEVPHTAMF